jgi:alpha-beta hydrolase superfamily lysophospholipase
MNILSMPVWFIFLVLTILIIVMVYVVLYFIQDKFIFHAEKLPADYKFDSECNFEEINLKTEDGTTLNGLYFKRQEPKGVILYFHNHAGNIKKWSERAIFFMNYNYDVLIMDYRGYGKSTGTFDEGKMFEDTQLWYDLISGGYSRIVVYVRGLGSAFAACIAANNNVDQVILEAPINSLHTAAKFLYPHVYFYRLMRYSFDTASCFKKINSSSITLFHCMQDTVVHYKCSEKLYELNKEHTELILIKNADHFNVMNHPLYMDTLETILQ